MSYISILLASILQKITCHHCKKPGNYRRQCRFLKKHREQAEKNQNNPGNKTVTPIPLNRTATSTIITTTKTVTRLKESQKLSTQPVSYVGKQTTPQKNATLEPMQPIDRLPGKEDRKDKIRSKKESIKMTRMKLLRLQPKS